jgi:hypothetical protein
MSSSAMLTPPESGESPTVGPREGSGFTAVNGGGHATNGNAAFTTVNAHQTPATQQPQNIVEGIWNKLAAEANRSLDSSTPSGPTQGHPIHPPESKAAVQQQIANANSAAVDRQISVEVAKLVASFRSEDAASEEVPQPNNSIPHHGLDYDGLRALRQYIYGEERGVQLDEEALLNHLEKTWREGVRADYHKMIENIPVFIARERAFLTWVELKRHLAALHRASERTSSPAILLHATLFLLTSSPRLVSRRPHTTRDRAPHSTTPHAHGLHANHHRQLRRRGSRFRSGTPRRSRS